MKWFFRVLFYGLARYWSKTPKDSSLLTTIPDGTKEVFVGDHRGRLALRQIWFGYEPGRVVLKDISIIAEKGQTIGIVGPSGAGKSTLIKLLLRQYVPQAGSIDLDQDDLRSLSRASIERLMGHVDSCQKVKPGTLLENLVLENKVFDLQHVEQAVRMAGLHDFIHRLSDGYNTQLGPDGQPLSPGQILLLHLARALLKDPPILLFDEGVLALTPEEEEALQRSLERVTRHRTTILVTHRLARVCRADRIYVLKNGQIVEVGHHEELLANGGYYTHLWGVQTGIRLLDRPEVTG